MKTLVALSIVAFALATVTPAFGMADAGGPYTFCLGDNLVLVGTGAPVELQFFYSWDLDYNGTYDRILTTDTLTLTPVDYATYFPIAGVYTIELEYSACVDCAFCQWQYWTDTATVTARDCAVPEPATMLLLGAGLFGLTGLRRRFRR